MKTHLTSCKICNTDYKTIKNEQGGGSGVHKLIRFNKHLVDNHNIDFTEYITKHCNEIQQKCKCGCNKNVTYNINKNKWNDYVSSCHSHDLSTKIKNHWKNNTHSRKGKSSWCKGFTKETHPKLMSSSLKQVGRVISKESIDKCALTKSKNQKSSNYKWTKTKPHNIVCNLLKSLNINFEEEKWFYIYRADIYLIDYDLIIEIDGDYWHANPLFYPNGPITKQQKYRVETDKRKYLHYDKNNLKYIRIWENDILKNIDLVKEGIICNMKK